MVTPVQNLLRSGAVSALALAFAGAPALRASADSWPVFGFDASRSSFNSLERTLTVGNVHRLRARWQIALGSVADTAPILLQHVRVGRAYRNVLFETTKSGETIAIEARSGRILWRFDTHGFNYTHSVPAADPAGKAIYVPGIDGKVHKLSAAKGRELSAPGFPAVITRAPQTEANESPLNVANGYLYATTSGYNGDGTPYDGHVVAINLQNGKRSVFNSLCSNRHKLIDPGSIPIRP
jgi:outer membrane protein assembly factor BamB